MRYKLIFAGLVLSGAHWVGHLLTLENLPGLIMDRARGQLVSAFGVQENKWTMAPRIDPHMRAIVRPSPDLAYSICLLDLSDGPMRITVPRGETYGSLSIFQRNTDNVFNVPLQGEGDGVDVIVSREQAVIPATGAAPDVVLNSTTGIALIRRLAPNAADFSAAATLSEEAECKLL
jgi:uncharacterized membrane protein